MRQKNLAIGMTCGIAMLLFLVPACSKLPSSLGNAEIVTAIDVTTFADDIQTGTGGLAIDNAGNLFTADFGWRLDGGGKGGDKVYKITPSGEVELFSTGLQGASGNAFDTKGNLYQSNIRGNLISKITPDGEVAAFARDDRFKSPVGIAFDSKRNLYSCNCGSNTILKITPDGKTSIFLKSPLLKCPNGIVLAEDGNFYVANFDNGDVIKVDAKGRASKFVTLPGNNNGHLTYHKGHLFVVARTANQIYQVTLDGKASLFVGSGDRGDKNGKPLECSLSLPNDLGFSPDGRFLYINEVGPTSGDPRVLGPTRIRRVRLQAAESDPEPSPQASSQQAKQDDVTIEQFGWIRGHWQGEALGGQFEETWNPPQAGEMMGMFKFISDGKVNFYEILTIVPVGDSFTVRLKHFNSELVGWEDKDESVEFPFVSLSKNEIRFEGLVFKKINEDEMVILVDTRPKNGKSQTLKFVCSRVEQRESQQESEKQAILKVFEIDQVLAKQRDHFPEKGTLEMAVRSYVLGLDSVDFCHCPPEFISAFQRHRDAWHESIDFFKAFDELHGEMHALFDQIRQRDKSAGKKLDHHFQSIMKTWIDVEAAAAKYGVK